jgi:hypothetical protein
MPPNVGNHLPLNKDGSQQEILTFTAQWAGMDNTDPKNQFDVCILAKDTDGQTNLWHFWYIPSVGWSGPERLNSLS